MVRPPCSGRSAVSFRVDTGQEELGTIQSTRVPQRLTGPALCFSTALPALAGLWGRGAPILDPTQLCSWPPPRPRGLLGPKPKLKLQTQQSSSSLVPARGGGGGSWRGQGASAGRGWTVITQGLGFLPQTQTCRKPHIKQCPAICADIQRSRP